MTYGGAVNFYVLLGTLSFYKNNFTSNSAVSGGALFI